MYVQRFLKVLCEAINLFSASKHATANLYVFGTMKGPKYFNGYRLEPFLFCEIF